MTSRKTAVRMAEVHRRTRETDVYVKVVLDSEGKSDIDTGVRFLNHLLTSLATHSSIDITVKAKGDLKHHTVEDLAIGLGEALTKALDKRRGINRFGYAFIPMDCSLAFSAVDLVKRPYSKIDLELAENNIEDLPSEDIQHFLETLSCSLQANIHMWIQYGKNDHHKTEAAFKALAVALKQALTIDSKRKEIPSSKGVM